MSLEPCLALLDDAIEAATGLGIDATQAASLRESARARLGFASDVYVLALAGGTGVGKSTLLNALAGADVSAASARRPTTAEPVAWLPAGRRRDLRELLEWLGVTRVHEHEGALANVAIVDLPDFDSIAADHRARVDAMLPRVDAVAWIVDPEKYKDEAIHGRYLREIAPRVRHQLVVLNRSDLLAGDDARRVSEDLRAQLRRDGAPEVEVIATRAKDGASGVATLRTWLDAGVDAKRVIAARIAADVAVSVRDLASRAGVLERADPLIDVARRERALSAVARASLAVVDIAGLERQAVAATRLAARPRGAGPLGHLTSAIYRLTGRARASADPTGYLRRWRSRGSLAPALEPVRELIAATLPTVPAPLRSRVSAFATPSAIEGRLADTIDRALTTEAAEFRVPTSPAWAVIGLAQYVVTAVLIFCAIWFASLFLIRDVPVSTVSLPFIGLVPMPVALLAGALLAGFVLAQLLRLHAGWLGSRWARRIGSRVSAEVRQRVSDDLLLPIDTFDSSRGALATAAREIDDCA